MPIFFLIGACIMLVLVGVGIVAAAVALAAIAVMVALGITSSAVVVGLLRRDFSSGMRAFHYQALAAIGMPAGVGILGFGVWLADDGMPLWMIFLVGAAGGACAGLVLAWVFDVLARVIYRRLALDYLPKETADSCDSKERRTPIRLSQ